MYNLVLKQTYEGEGYLFIYFNGVLWSHIFHSHFPHCLEFGTLTLLNVKKKKKKSEKV